MAVVDNGARQTLERASAGGSLYFRSESVMLGSIRSMKRRNAKHGRMEVKGLCLVFGLLAFRQHNSDFSVFLFAGLATT